MCSRQGVKPRLEARPGLFKWGIAGQAAVCDRLDHREQIVAAMLELARERLLDLLRAFLFAHIAQVRGEQHLSIRQIGCRYRHLRSELASVGSPRRDFDAMAEDRTPAASQKITQSARIGVT